MSCHELMQPSSTLTPLTEYVVFKNLSSLDDFIAYLKLKVYR